MASGWAYSTDGVTVTFQAIPHGVNIFDFVRGGTFNGSTYSVQVTDIGDRFVRLGLAV
jgi:hypothetical protein